MSLIRLTTFDRSDPRFKKAVRDFGPGSAAEVWVDIEDFEDDWKNGMEDAQLYARYNYKKLKYKQRPYFRLFQIRVGPNRKNLSYRAVVMFYDEQVGAIWIHAFKKEGDSEPQEIELAVARADECWNKIDRTRRIR